MWSCAVGYVTVALDEAHKLTSCRCLYRSNFASSSDPAKWAESSYVVVHPVGLQRRG